MFDGMPGVQLEIGKDSNQGSFKKVVCVLPLVQKFWISLFLSNTMNVSTTAICVFSDSHAGTRIFNSQKLPLFLAMGWNLDLIPLDNPNDALASSSVFTTPPGWDHRPAYLGS